MNERIKELAKQAEFYAWEELAKVPGPAEMAISKRVFDGSFRLKFAELIVREMCGLMEQAEDDAYHCFDPSERPTERIEWLRDWQERFTKHFGVEE
jgi:hypothetical protein